MFLSFSERESLKRIIDMQNYKISITHRVIYVDGEVRILQKNLRDGKQQKIKDPKEILLI